MVEDHRHGGLQHGERHGAEEEEHQDAHDPHHLPLRQKAADLVGDCVGLAQNQEFQIGGHSVQQALFVDEMEERDASSTAKRGTRDSSVL